MDNVKFLTKQLETETVTVVKPVRYEGAARKRLIFTSNRLHKRPTRAHARETERADLAGYVLFVLLTVALLFVAAPFAHWLASH